MKGKKLKRFAELTTFKNVLEYPTDSKSEWASIFNSNDMILELACGKGEYTVEMAQAFPDKNFIGVDIKGNRMYVGAKLALQKGLRMFVFCVRKLKGLQIIFIHILLPKFGLHFQILFSENLKPRTD